MFYSRRERLKRRTNSKRAERGSRAAGRCLRVESMEGRLMLSTTTATPGETPTDFVQIAPIQVQTLRTYVDGGFVQSSYVPLNNDVVTFHVLKTSDQTNGTTIPDLLSDGSFLSTNVVGEQYMASLPASFNSYTFNSYVDGGGIIVRVSGGFPLMRFPSPQVAANPEGGAIPIDPVLPKSTPSLVRKPETLLVSATPKMSDNLVIDSQLAIATAKPSSSEISGEWARAAVFEIAGGESTTVASDSTGVQGNDLHEAEPVTSDDPAPAPVHTVAYNSTEQMPEHPRKLSAFENESNSFDPRITISPSAIVGDNNVPSLFDARANGSKTVAALAGPILPADVRQADAQTRKVAAAAFDQLGADDAAFCTPSIESRRSGTSFFIKPMVLILALERIATRRERRDDTAVVRRGFSHP